MPTPNAIPLELTAFPHEEADTFMATAKENDSLAVVIGHTLNHTVIAHELYTEPATPTKGKAVVEPSDSEEADNEEDEEKDAEDDEVPSPSAPPTPPAPSPRRKTSTKGKVGTK